jgi:hypothetical protein
MPKIKRLGGFSSTAFLPTMKVGFFMGKMREIVVSRPSRRAADFTRGMFRVTRSEPA